MNTSLPGTVPNDARRAVARDLITTCGLTAAQVATLERRDVLDHGSRLLVRRALGAVHRGRPRTVHYKKPRSVDLPPLLATALAAHLEIYTDTHPGARVFPGLVCEAIASTDPPPTARDA